MDTSGKWVWILGVAHFAACQGGREGGMEGGRDFLNNVAGGGCG